MSAITVTSASVAALPGATPVIVGVTSSGAAALFNFTSSLWTVLSMVTT